METLIIKSYILNKELTELNQEELTIKCKGLDANNNMVYTYSLPKHIYDNIVDTSVEFQSYQKFIERKKKEGANFKYSETYLSKNIEDVLISSLIDKVVHYSNIILSEKNKTNLQRDKKIFINFKWSDNHDRCNWTGGYMGRVIQNSFQYFIGYEIEEQLNVSSWFTGDKSNEGKTVKNYYTLIKHATGSLAKNSTNFLEGDALEPLYYKQGNNREEFLSRFNIIDWTQEREDYLKEIQNKFVSLNTNLNDYLSNLDNLKLDSLIEQKNELKFLM